MAIQDHSLSSVLRSVESLLMTQLNVNVHYYVGVISKTSEDMDTESTEKSPLSTIQCRLTPANISINLILPKTRVHGPCSMGCIFALRAYWHQSKGHMQLRISYQ